MMRSSRVMSVLVCGMAFLGGVALAQETDVEGSKDHPLISRYPGSVIERYAQNAFDEFRLPLGKSNGDGTFGKSLTLQGKITRIEYAVPSGRSVLEVFRNYESALKKAGFETLYTCASSALCGGGNPALWTAAGEDDWDWSTGMRYTSAKARVAEGLVHVSLHIGQWADLNRGPHITLYVVESKAMDADLVKVDAVVLADDITKTGHTAIYGIYFDTGKAEVKPESDAALAEIAKMLKQNARLKLMVVGHTDTVGDLTANMDLSKRRAAAVVQTLVAKQGIAASRLAAQGAGPLAPVASNKTEEGRARNRRVELVEQ
jgi:outer membrane protein OmpA-like peptidoglycan-associated protein